MKRAFGQMALGNLLAAGLGAFIVVLAARGMEPSVWANAAIIVGVGPAAGVILSLGSVSFQIREISFVESGEERRRLASTFNARRLVFAAPIIVVGLASIDLLGNTIGLITILAGTRFIRGGAGVLYSSDRRFACLSLFIVIEKMVCLLGVLALSASGLLSPAGVALSYAFSYLVYVLLCLVVEGRINTSMREFAHAARTPWRIWDGSRAFGVASLVGPAQQLDVSVVSLVVGPVEAGLFASASRMVGGLNFAGSALASVALPYFSAAESVVRPVSIRLALAASSGALGLAIATVLGAPVWVPWLLGPEYSSAVGAISAYLIAIMVLTVNQPLMAILQARKREGFVMWVAVGQSLGGLCAIALGALAGGATGAACGYLFICGSIMIVLLIRLRGLRSS